MEDKQLILKELKGLEDKIVPVLAKQDEEIKAHKGTSLQTAKVLGDLEKKHDALESELKALNSTLTGIETKMGRPQYKGREVKQIGSAFVESKQFKDMVARGAKGSEMLQLGSLQNYAGWEQKDLSGNAAMRAVMSTYLDQTFYYDPLRPNRVRDLLPVYPTRFAAIEFVKETVLNINAAMVAEGSQKPESSIVFDDAISLIRTLAHHMPVPRQLLEDINGLGEYLNKRLLGGLKMVEDDQLLYGDGVGQNLEGLMVVNGTQTYSWSAGTHGDTQIDALRRAMTLAQLAYYPVDGIIMNPRAWEAIELLKSTEGLYVWVNVASGAAPNLFKVPIVTTTAMHATDVLLGAFNMACAVWDREEANMRISDSHLGQFTQNMVTMLLEERIGLTVFRPKSLIKVSLDNAPA